MIDIQKLINKWKQQLFILENAEENHKRQNRYSQAFECRVAQEQLRQCITDIELLLRHDESKQPQPPISQTPMLDEMPQVVSPQSEDTTQAVVGATPVVRQNEQIQKSCNHSCGLSDWYRGGKCDKMGCYYEDELQKIICVRRKPCEFASGILPNGTALRCTGI